MANWIRATELPPDKWNGQSDLVLVHSKQLIQSCILIAYYDFYKKQWRNPFGPVDEVSHWQPLPERPMEE